jgi:hypothetical protein
MKIAGFILLAIGDSIPLVLWLVVIIRLGELSGLLSVDIWYGLPIRKDKIKRIRISG